MKKIVKIIIGLLLIVFTGLISFGLFTSPKVNDASSTSFSAERVASDIKIISSDHHSFFHPRERAIVADFLSERLSSMGGTPELFTYDSIPFRYGGYYTDMVNIYCKYTPTDAPLSSYILLLAHYDSRFYQEVLKDTVWSYGAADDGYGVASALELTKVALSYQNEWKQGIKVLFTDGEENSLDGIKKMYSDDRHLLDSVALVVNMEARGVKGPVLLFETSKGNSKLLDLYKHANFPYTYSLTSVVYAMMPNFTDFNVIKDTIAGVNFSNLDNMNYYHTDKDNYSNINLKTIQHYGSQLEPMLKEYLTGSEYASSDSFKSVDDKVYFTIPGFNLIAMTKSQYLLFNAITFALFCIAFAMLLLTKGIRIKYFLYKSLIILGVAIGVAAVGEGIAYISALLAGTKFNLVSTKYIKFDYLITILSITAMAFGYIMFFLKKNSKSKLFNKEMIMAILFVLTVLSAILYFVIGENFFFLVPLAFGALAVILYHFVYLNNLALPALLIIFLLQLSFLYNLYTALTIGALGVIMMIAFLTIVLMVGLFECYLNQKR